MAHRVSRSDLIGQLTDQLGFLRRSAAAYDRGDEGEAKRLATSLRLLLHDHGQSHSLLGQLGLKSRLRWLDTAERINPRNLAPTNGLVVVRVRTSADAPVDARYVPPLDERPPLIRHRPSPFDPWWTTDIVKDGRGHLFSRKSLVRAVANQDGGAHVDPELDEDYTALSRLNSLGVVAVDEPDGAGAGIGGPGQPASGNPALAAVRQIAFEVGETLTLQVRWLVEDDERSLFGGDGTRIARGEPCPCGSTHPASECCLTESERAFELGNELKSRGELDLAIDALDVSSQLGHRLAPFNLGLALAERGDFEGAETAFRVATTRGDGEAASNLGMLLAERGDDAGAKASYEEGVRLDSPTAAFNLGQLHFTEGDRAQAKEMWERGAEQGNPDAAFRAGNLCREDGELTLAMKLYGQARAAGHAQATFNHALMLKDAGMPKSARAALEQAASMGDERVASRARFLLETEMAPQPPVEQGSR